MPAAETSPILAGSLASLLAGGATALGALPTLAVERVPRRAQDTLLGFAAGVMLAASFFSLILPGIDVAAAQGASRTGAVSIVGAGVLLGALGLGLIHRYVPHEHFVSGREGPDADKLRRIWLFVLAITLHNVPEGLAVGVAYGGDDPARAAAVAVGIGLQNVPEGLAVAVSLSALSYTRWQVFAVAAATGLVEPLGGLVGVSAVTLARPLLPWGLALAAGAMLYVITDEVIPETHRRGSRPFGTAGLMVGLVVMMVLDVVFG
jgi:ZIP family zinc transporter